MLEQEGFRLSKTDGGVVGAWDEEKGRWVSWAEAGSGLLQGPRQGRGGSVIRVGCQTRAVEPRDCHRSPGLVHSLYVQQIILKLGVLVQHPPTHS